MSEFAGFDLDRSTARAWSSFQARLADHVAEMSDGDLFLVEAESPVEDGEGAAPYVQFCGWGDELVRCEVSSNEYLADGHRLDPMAARTLAGLGWSEPTYDRGGKPDEGSANFYVDLDRSHADKLAVMTVRALREIFGVTHPAFLASGNFADDETAEESESPTLPGEPDPDEPLAVIPEGREHLKALVDEALTPYFGHTPHHDEDDDIPVVAGSALIFVRVVEEAPVIQLFSCMVNGVTDLDRAGLEIGFLNRDQRFLKFALVADRVMTYVDLPAYPFVARHLRVMLASMTESVDQIDDDLAARVGGRRSFEPDDLEELAAPDDAEVEDDAMHPSMMTLLQLDAESPGSVGPELAASVCGMDRDLILELITWNSEQEIEWRRARDNAILAGDPNDEADVCDGEMQHAERTTNLLRRALRLVVERELGRDPGEGYGG